MLSRVTAEILKMEKSFNKECGVSASSDFAAAYLNILRSSGMCMFIWDKYIIARWNEIK